VKKNKLKSFWNSIYDNIRLTLDENYLSKLIDLKVKNHNLKIYSDCCNAQGTYTLLECSACNFQIKAHVISAHKIFLYNYPSDKWNYWKNKHPEDLILSCEEQQIKNLLE